LGGRDMDSRSKHEPRHGNLPCRDEVFLWVDYGRPI
jgi:hypothetical protein